MQILAAQMQYQDPLQPVSSTQMVAQLMQYEMLDALLQIEKELAPGSAAASSATAGSSTTPSAASPGTAAGPSGTALSTGTAISAGTTAKP